jgi:arylsulfate sulfotransferase
MQATLKYRLRDIPGNLACGLVLLLGAGALSPSLYATVSSVHIKGSAPSPQLLGTTIALTASAVDTNPGPLTYKWEVETPSSSSFLLMQDFDVATSFQWTPNYTEGTYQLRLTARDYLAGTSAQQVVSFRVNPLVTGSQAVVVPTANPLVALLSAPTCPIGSTMRAMFQPSDAAFQSYTNWRSCHVGSMNFYMAGMEASQTFLMAYQVDTGGTITTSPSLTFTTGAIPASVEFPTMTVVPPATSSDAGDRIVLTGFAAAPYPITATDMSANVIWYYPPTPTQLTRPVLGGTMLTILDGYGTGTGVWGPDINRQQILREIDLAGNTVRETNADRVMEQLTAMGMTDPLGSFNHDAIRLASNLAGSAAGLSGYTIAVGNVQRIFPAGTQGASGPIDIVGTLLIVLDTNLQVVGYWDSFDYDCAGSSGTTCQGGLSINRPAVRGEVCTTGAGLAGCPPMLLSSPANDWLHANSVQYLPSDGDLLVSLRNQDWVVKIDYNSGVPSGRLGTGNILWSLGLDGNFALGNTNGEPYPWFSGQHDAGFATPPGGSPEQIFTVFDNGVSRHEEYGGNSRGQVWNIDQTTMIATLTTDANLGAYSFSLGSAQMLTNGNFMFMAGNIQGAGGLIETQNSEVLPSYGTIVYQLQALGPVSYRGARLTDFYNVQTNGSSGPE